LVVAPAAAEAGADLRSRLDAVLQSRGLEGARIGALVVGRDDGRVVYQREPDRPLVPASNLKILTSLAALSVWGPTHRFVTEILATSPPDAQGSIGTLVVRGGGDPALTSEQLWRLAADLRLLGIRRVRDGLLLDASAFDDEHWHPGWGARSARAYHAPVAALSANYAAIAVVVEAGAREGDPLRVRLDPPIPYLRLKNLARTGSSSARANLVVDRQRAGAAEEVVVSGELRAGSRPATYYRSVLDPVRYAGAVLRMQLQANGITVEGEDRVGRTPDSTAWGGPPTRRSPYSSSRASTSPKSSSCSSSTATTRWAKCSSRGWGFRVAGRAAGRVASLRFARSSASSVCNSIIFRWWMVRVFRGTIGSRRALWFRRSAVRKGPLLLARSLSRHSPSRLPMALCESERQAPPIRYARKQGSSATSEELLHSPVTRIRRRASRWYSRFSSTISREAARRRGPPSIASRRNSSRAKLRLRTQHPPPREAADPRSAPDQLLEIPGL